MIYHPQSPLMHFRGSRSRLRYRGYETERYDRSVATQPAENKRKGASLTRCLFRRGLPVDCMMTMQKALGAVTTLVWVNRRFVRMSWIA